MPGPFFIVTTGRSGSTTITRALSVLHNVHAVHEPPPELILESSGYRYGTTSAEEVRTLLRETRGPIVGRSIYVESNQTLSLIIPEIAQVFPEARFVWLLRNGLDVVGSTMQKQWYTGHSEHHDRYEDCPPLEKAWIDGRIAGDRCGAMSAQTWQSLGRFEKCCWYWDYVNRVIEEDLAEHASDRLIMVRLEEMDRRLGELTQWMGLRAAVLPSVPHSNKAKRRPYHHTDWSRDDREVFARLCGEQMDRLYAGWRRDGEIVGVLYEPPRWTGSIFARRARFARRLNAVFARNRIV